MDIQSQSFSRAPFIVPPEVVADLQAMARTPKSDRKPKHQPGKRYFPTIFISDLHLGARSCRAEELLAFLQSHVADTIYLVGDIFDIWRPIGSRWTKTHHDIFRLLLDRAKSGVRLVYTPGNHDEFFRNYFGTYFECVEVADYVYHTASDGSRYLVIHGDCCDEFEQRAPLLSKLGAHCEGVMRGVQDCFNWVASGFGMKREWNGIDWCLNRINSMLRAQDSFQFRLTDLAKEHEVDGIICGHFHQAALHSDHGVVYANCGDWTENCTALAETSSGGLMLVDWAAHGATAPVPAAEDEPVSVRA